MRVEQERQRYGDDAGDTNHRRGPSRTKKLTPLRRAESGTAQYAPIEPNFKPTPASATKSLSPSDLPDSGVTVFQVRPVSKKRTQRMLSSRPKSRPMLRARRCESQRRFDWYSSWKSISRSQP